VGLTRTFKGHNITLFGFNSIVKEKCFIKINTLIYVWLTGSVTVSKVGFVDDRERAIARTG
jgi:hypothetical protein